jgi:quinol monooxygenase YgiN
MNMVHLDYHVTPFRAQKFAELYWPAVPRVLAYGAKAYMFYRSVDDADHFVHASIWEDKADFQRYWFSREMQELRERIAGLHGQPLLPTWNTILEQG